MDLPQVSNNNVASFLNQAEIVQATAEQIMKDFGMFGVEITFSGDTSRAYDELHHQLIYQITLLLERNYDLLLSVLYQVDITCLLYTSDAADDLLCVDLGGRRIIKKK